ncbi:MAG: carboxypeptidase regulatory-like domain-containing protein, partial [Candidatus Kapaibacterium sp.]
MHRSRCVVILFFMALVLAAPMTAQTTEVTISGSVRDSVTGEVIIRATVSLSVGDDAPSVRGALTNTFGFFSIPKLEARAYTLRIRSIGYAPVQMRLTEQQVRSQRQLALTMKPVDLMMGDVVVSGGYGAATTRWPRCGDGVSTNRTWPVQHIMRQRQGIGGPAKP